LVTAIDTIEKQTPIAGQVWIWSADVDTVSMTPGAIAPHIQLWKENPNPPEYPNWLKTRR
jgi:hypothetical protein